MAAAGIAMPSAATAAISASLVLSIMVVLLRLVAKQKADAVLFGDQETPCCLLSGRCVRGGQSSTKFLFSTLFTKIE
jgi:hypothetical protein